MVSARCKMLVKEELMKLGLHFILVDMGVVDNLFSDIQGITIEKFIIFHKIERIKELIIYDELSLKEIAWNMHYCSVSHLSNQFKMITGLSPTHYKNLKNKRRSPLEEIGNPDNVCSQSCGELEEEYNLNRKTE